MERSVGISEAKSRLGELIAEAKYGGTTFILRRHNQPMAVLIGVDEFERLRAPAGQGGSTVQAALSPEMLRRQEALIARARSLRERLGPPRSALLSYSMICLLKEMTSGLRYRSCIDGDV